MAAPAVPTLTTLTTEGLKKAGDSNPSSALLTRAQEQWMEEIKNDIYTRQKLLRSLHKVGIVHVSQGYNEWQLPSDFGKAISAKLANGLKGNISSGSASSVTFDSADTNLTTFAGTNYLRGRQFYNLDKQYHSQFAAYIPASRIGALAPDLAGTQDASDAYMVVTDFSPLFIGDPVEFDKIINPTVVHKPSTMHMVGDEDSGRIMFDCLPDQVYAVQLRYYVNLMMVDLASTLMSTLYQKYRNVWIYGVRAKRLDDKDDDKAMVADREYRSYLNAMVAAETVGVDMSNLQAKLSE